jgi:mRNA interferase RelE/StbE
MIEIRFTKDAMRALVRMDATIARLIREKIDQFADDPTSLAGNLKRLRGSRLLRLRVQDYRVIMDLDGTVLLVVKIGHRSKVYDD